MKKYRLVANAISDENRQQLSDAVLSHPLVGSSPLKGAFSATRGFSIAFTSHRIPELINKFSFLAGFFAAIELDKGLAHLYSPFSFTRLCKRLVRPNAFYFNTLLVPPKAKVSRHVDGTLQPYLDIPNLRPKMVSVLWLQSNDSGRLELFDGMRKLASIPPKIGNVIHFRGNLGHAVSVVRGNRTRVSMVLEQYVVPQDVTELLEPWVVHSKVPFATHLAQAQQELQQEEPD